MSRTRPIRATGMVLLGLWAHAPAQDGEPAVPLAQRLAELVHAHLGERAFAELVELGEPAAQAALEGFAAQDPAARRARSLLVREAGREGQIPGALELLIDPDSQVRRNGILFLARPELRDASTRARVEALERVARSDAERELRAEALRALGRIDQAESVEVLARLARELDGAGRTLAARGLASQVQARERLVGLVVAAFDPRTPPGERLADDALAELFGAPYGQALADLPAGGTRAEDLMPFALGARHPAGAVRAGASAALERFVVRAQFLGDTERAGAVLESLLGRGLDDDALLSRRARLALESGGQADAALAAARTLVARAEGADELSALRRRSQAGLLSAAALCSAGRFDEVEAVLEPTAAALDSLLARRLDLRSPRMVVVQVDMLERRALVELYGALAELARSAEVAQPAVLGRARAAHEYSLRAQLALIGQWTRITSDGTWPNPWGLDSLLGDELSPWRLVLASPAGGGLAAARALELKRKLCVALASVAPLEMPGFQPVEVLDPAVADPRQDPRRRDLLKLVLSAYQGALLDMAELAVEPERRQLLSRVVAQLEAERQRDEGTTWNVHLRQRLPSDAALPLAEELRAEGRTGAARALVERLQSDMGAAVEILRGAWGEDLEARADVVLGSTWMDEDQPERAEQLYQRALERLDVLESDLRERGVGEDGLALMRVRKADVLVSLAVNANVKQRNVQKAVDFFERAYELREDDFMRVLLACYRARAGRDAEARAVLRDLPVAPANYYNLACTYTLLGDLELGLDYLRRDFAEIRGSPGQLERQKSWARGDPDLQGLRGDARFEALVLPSPDLETEDK